MSEALNKIGERGLDSVLDNPFAKASITQIYVTYKQNTFSKEWYAYGTVEFKKNNTKGEVRFDGKTFDEVAVQIKNFIENEL